jgi:hypothetical protein
VQSITDVPLSIDSSIVAALEAGLAVYKGKALVNSVTGEDERLESVLPLVKKYGAAVIAISNDETGISEDPDVRFAVAKKIVERAPTHGIPASDVVVDPLVMPIGAINRPACRSCAWCTGCAPNSRSTPPAAPRTSASGCRTATASTRVPDDGDRRRHDLGDHQSAARRSRQGGAWARTS